jgi:hypothetical protein
MAALVLALHVLPLLPKQQDVDARHEAGMTRQGGSRE